MTSDSDIVLIGKPSLDYTVDPDQRETPAGFTRITVRIEDCEVSMHVPTAKLRNME